MPRRSDTTITIGVAGLGEVDEVTSKELLEDFFEREDNAGATVQFVFLITEEDYTDSLDGVLEVAYKGGHDFRVVTDAESKGNKTIKETYDAATKGFTSADPATRFVQVLADAGQSPNPTFFCLYDAEDEPTVQLAWELHDLDIPGYDLTNAMEPLVFGDEADTGEPDEAPEGEEEEEMNVELLEALAGHHEAVAETIREHLNGNGAEPVAEEVEEEEEPEEKPRRRRSRAAAAEEPEEEVEEEDEPPRRRRASSGNGRRTRASSGNGRRTRGAAKAAPAPRKKAASGNGRRTSTRATGRRTRTRA